MIIDNITASSVRCMSPAYFGRLHFSGSCFSAWCSKTQFYDPQPWLSVSLGTSYNILFVATQGVNQEPNMYFPVKYLVKYQADGTTNESLVTYKEKGIDKVNTWLSQKCCQNICPDQSEAYLEIAVDALRRKGKVRLCCTIRFGKTRVILTLSTKVNDDLDY